jgi:hypothetical protein
MNEYHKVVLAQIVAKWVFLDFLLSVSLLYDFVSLLKHIPLYLESLQYFVSAEHLDKIVVVLWPDSWVTNNQLSQGLRPWFDSIEDVRAIDLTWLFVLQFKPPKRIKLTEASLPRCLEITTYRQFTWYCQAAKGGLCSGQDVYYSLPKCLFANQTEVDDFGR